MNDYIKREDAVRKIARANAYDLCAEYGQHFSLDKVNFESEMENALKFLADIPSADVTPVRHGRWKGGKPMIMCDIKGNLSFGSWYTCTCCEFKTSAIGNHITQYNYCPNCGSRMDEEKE